METYAARLLSFNTAHPAKKRGSDTKGTKALKWPLKNISADELANAGFFYRPTASNPDNTVCFLCGNNVDGWEEDDNAVMEHLKLSPECGWAINVHIEQQLENGNYEIENPLDEKLMESRKMTFGSRWPHENKRGWVCKTQKMIESGWHYCPTAESDDYAKCSYCGLSLAGWEPKDNPYDEHKRRSPQCIFFSYTDPLKPKRGRQRKSRTSKASRMSTQSNITTVSEVASMEEPESIILATTEVERPIKAAKGAKKGAKAKKAPAKSKAKAAATKADDSALASSFIEPEDDDFEVKVEKISTKSGRNKKRGSDEINGEHDVRPAENNMTQDVECQPPPAKRRATRSRSSVTQNGDSAHFLQNEHELNANMTDAEMMPPPAALASKKGVKKGRKQPSSAVRIASDASIASVASLRSEVPDDESITAALEEDLNRPLTDDEVEIKPEIKPKQPRRLTRTRPTSRHGTAHASVAALRVLPPSNPEGPKCREPSRRLPGRKNRHGTPPTSEEVDSILPVKLTENPTDQPAMEASAITAEESEFVDAMSVQSTPRPVYSPQSSDAENQPPSSRPSATRPPLSVKSQVNTQTNQIRSAVCTPTASPSKPNTLRLQSVVPWMPADVERLFLGSPSGNDENDPFTMGAMIMQDVNDGLTVPEKQLSMEEWIRHKARQAEEKLRTDCERLIGKFEGEGVRALMTLEGISCTD
ncbi:hypothetical protein MMC07_000373 [Pseudocyphellaria aurata]|nr:hypothetical protein [Pseudocyphellaria aurata]